ncbi:MAG: hypothetical protein FJX53_05370 [Alphaproteobacteria bacterium]|nr:hypothetical protein [Alphaproteobacteria bacterium]
MYTRLALVLCVLAASLVHGWPDGSVHVDYADAGDYLVAAHQVAEHGVFTRNLSVDGTSPAPGVGREPGYSWLLAAVMLLDPAFADYDPACLSHHGGCGGALYASLQLLNGALIGLAGLLVWLAIRGIAGERYRLAAWLGGAHIWLNFEAASSAEYAVSDYLALALGSGLVVALVHALRTRQPAWAGIAGFALSGLVLTKAVYFYFAIVAVPVLALHLIFRHRPRAGGCVAAMLLVATFIIPIGTWMARNADVGGTWSISAGRTAIVLSTREVFNHMTPSQYAAAFVYWTRAFGDGLAKKLFAEPDWKPFEIYDPNGFYLVGQTRLEPEYTTLIASGLSPAAAESRLTRRIIVACLERPVAFIASTVPLIWRGIWIDEFIAFSGPALIWLAVHGIRRRRWDIAAALSPGVFSLLFYALASLNIPRYQITALPALAIAFGVAVASIQCYRAARRSALAPAVPRPASPPGPTAIP